MLDGRVCKREGGSLSSASTNPDRPLLRCCVSGALICEENSGDMLLPPGGGWRLGVAEEFADDYVEPTSGRMPALWKRAEA